MQAVDARKISDAYKRLPSYLDGVFRSRGHKPGAQVDTAPHHGVLASLRGPHEPAVDLPSGDADTGPKLQPLKCKDYFL